MQRLDDFLQPSEGTYEMAADSNDDNIILKNDSSGDKSEEKEDEFFDAKENIDQSNIIEAPKAPIASSDSSNFAQISDNLVRQPAAP